LIPTRFASTFQNRRGDAEAAVELYRRALDIEKRTLGLEHRCIFQPQRNGVSDHWVERGSDRAGETERGRGA
jgi:hypothetical protein